ncbi:MAG TPA: TRAP transporter large permease subunit [Burkholderiales bacterium]|jgi:tripartite ATP-independent transporter DctM subunit
MSGLELLGMAMLVVMLFAIFIGIPISFTLLFLALIFGLIGLGGAVFDLAYLQILGLMKQDEFVAVPMFILMGYVCDQAGLMERLFKAFRDLFAPVRGSLYLVVIATATLFGIAAGTVGATVALLGIMAGPMMIKSGYDARMSAGAITAGGTLGILIPPSVMLVVMGPVLGISVLQLYAAAFGPGFLLAGMYMLYTMVRSHFDPKLGPPIPKEERQSDYRVVLWECVVGLVPVTVLTFATLGVILAGITTSTEAAAMGAAGAILLVIAYGRFTWKGLFEACHSTLATTSMVLFLAVASNVFGAVFARLGTATWITNMLLAVPLPAWGTMSLLLLLIFLLGWPFEWPAIVLIFLPMLAPVATGLGYDMVWFGTITAVVLQTAFLSPPVAMSAYYLKQVVKDWSLSTIYRGMADFMVIQVLCVILVLAFPQIAMWFPQWLEAGDRMAVPALKEDSTDSAIERDRLEAGDSYKSE